MSASSPETGAFSGPACFSLSLRAHPLQILEGPGPPRPTMIDASATRYRSNEPKSTWLVSTRLDKFDMSNESRRACRTVLFQHGGRRKSYSARLYKFSRFMLLHTQILFVLSNKINSIDVYSNKLVNNLHIITSYKLHNKLSCMSSQSSSSRRVFRAVLFDKLDTAKIHGLDTSNVLSRVLSRRNEPSGIWAIPHIVSKLPL